MLKMSETSVLSPVSFSVPRRDKTFSAELFPPSPIYSPAMTAEEWAGGLDKSPLLGSCDPATSASVSASASEEEISPLPPSFPNSSPNIVSTPSLRGLKNTSRYGNGSSTYRHVFGKSGTKAESYFNLDPKITTMDSSLLTANNDFFALPYAGGGGQVYVNKLSKTGKTEAARPLLNTNHTKSVCSLQFNTFDSHMLATGSDDCTVKIFTLNEEGGDVTVGENTLSGHRNSVREVLWHPLTGGILASR